MLHAISTKSGSQHATKYSVEETTSNYLLTAQEIQNVIKKPLKEIVSYFKNNVYLVGEKVFLKENAVKEFLEKNGVNYSFRVITHINLRGGCGKTTTSISLASRAKAYGHKVCIIDLDPQASVTRRLNIKAPPDRVFLKLLRSYEDLESVMADVLVKIEENLFIIPSSLSNSRANIELSSDVSSTRLSVKYICNYLEKLGFTLVVIDNAPSISPIMASTVCASDTVVIPVFPDFCSLSGVESMLQEIIDISKAYVVNQPEVKILFSKYEKRKRLSLQIYKILSEDEIYSKMLLPLVIRTSTSLEIAYTSGKTIFAGPEKTENKKSREDYDFYTRTILNIG